MAKEKKEKKPKLTKEEKIALKEEKKAQKAQAKEDKRLAKLEAKAKKRGKKFDPNDPEWEDEEGGTLLVVLVAFMIIMVWLAIVAALVKMDVGGIGSTVLYPVLKDVPVVNRILPGIDDELARQAKIRAREKAKKEARKEAEEAAMANPYGFSSMEEAIQEIQKLEKRLAKEKKNRSKNAAANADLQAQVKELSSYKDRVDKFEEEKEKFYQEVVFSDKAPDIKEYKAYYESIDPENAEQIYKQVVQQMESDNAIKAYATTYSTMDAAQAAAIFDTMENNLNLVAKILDAMSVQDRSAILSAMTKENAAKLTEMMEPK